MRGFSAHFRSNAIAYAALFVALGGTAYSAATISSSDIERNAVRSKHVKAGEVKDSDADVLSLGNHFGAGAMGGEVEDFGSAENSSTARGTPMMGLDRDGVADEYDIKAPIDVVIRDLHFSKLGPPVPDGRAVSFTVNGFGEPETLSCTLEPGDFECGSEGDEATVLEGDRITASIRTEFAEPVLPDADYLFSYRIVPSD